MFHVNCDRCGAAIDDEHKLHQVVVLQWLHGGPRTWTPKMVCGGCIQLFWRWAVQRDMAPLERVERAAIVGARNDPRPDQSDWIRVWAAAREGQGKPSNAPDWQAALQEA